MALAFSNVCFISYRHPGHEASEKIVQTFWDVLQGQVDKFMPGRPVYWDKARLQAGYLFNANLASELCQSACMIVLFNPSYFDLTHTYCAREYRGMVALEARRLARLMGSQDATKGLIIPVVISGEEDLPAELKANRYYVSLEKEVLIASDLKKRRESIKKIAGIAREIYLRCRTLERIDGICGDCGTFQFPTDEEIKTWLENVVAPPQPQPGR